MCLKWNSQRQEKKNSQYSTIQFGWVSAHDRGLRLFVIWQDWTGFWPEYEAIMCIDSPKLAISLITKLFQPAEPLLMGCCFFFFPYNSTMSYTNSRDCCVQKSQDISSFWNTQSRFGINIYATFKVTAITFFLNSDVWLLDLYLSDVLHCAAAIWFTYLSINSINMVYMSF